MPANFDTDTQIKVSLFLGDALSTGTTGTDVSKYVRSFESRRLSSPRLDQTQPGVTRMVLDNRDGRFDPTDTGSPYSPNLTVNTRMAIQTINSGTTYDVYTGFVSGWPQSFPGMKDNTVTVVAVDGFKHLSRYENTFTESQELSGTRVGNLLDEAGWPTPWRDIDAGSHTVIALSSEFNSALAEIRRAELVEQGTFWISGDGFATYRDGTTLIEDQVTPASTYGDGTAGALGVGVPLQMGTNDTQLWNKAFVTRDGGTEQSATSTGSVDNYGEYDLHLSNTLHVSDGESLSLANWVVSEHDDPERPMVDRITVLPQDDPSNLWSDVFSRELLDRVRVAKQTGGTAFNEDFHVSGIVHRVNVLSRSWMTEYQLRNVLSSTDWWILGTSELDVDTRLAY